MCTRKNNLTPLPSLQEAHFMPVPAEFTAIERSLKLAEKNSSRPPRSLRDFQAQYARIQELRLA
jgi:hypothetical protein